jgi:hypothetical protein
VLEQRLVGHAARLADIDSRRAVAAMLDFYLSERADDADIDADGDMLLFQWGTYGFHGAEPMFQYDITRQFISAEDDDDDGSIWQLSLCLHFDLDENLLAIESGNHWCHNPDGVSDLLEFISTSAAGRAVATRSATRVNLELGQAG